MMLCSITSPLFDLHKLIRLIVRRLPPPLSSSNRLFEYIHRIKEEEEEYFILCLPSCLFLSHPKWEIERQQGWRTWISRTIAFFQSTYFPRIDRRINARVRRRKKERKKEMPIYVVRNEISPRLRLAPLALSTRGTHDKKCALDWRKSRWFVDPALS